MSKFKHTPRVFTKSTKINVLAITSRTVRDRSWKFYMMFFMTIESHKTNFSFNFVQLGLHGLYRWPISDNGTTNALLTPSTTELSTLGRMFGIRRQNFTRKTLSLKKNFLVENGEHPSLTPENWNLEKISGLVFHYLPIRLEVKGPTEGSRTVSETEVNYSSFDDEIAW